MPTRRCPKQDLPGGKPLGYEKRHAASAGLFVSAAGGMQGSVVAVGGHQVQAVEIVGGAADVNVTQDGSRGGQGRSDEVMFLGEVEACGGEEGEEVGALKGIGGVLPHDCV